MFLNGESVWPKAQKDHIRELLNYFDVGPMPANRRVDNSSVPVSWLVLSHTPAREPARAFTHARLRAFTHTMALPALVPQGFQKP